MAEQRIIGITGRARHGKSTAARGFVALGWAEDSFAAPIRRYIADLLGISLAELEATKDDRNPLFGRTPRHMMQTLGTEWGRQLVDDLIWVKALFHRNATTSLLVISDVRFPNEANYIRALGGNIIHVYRPNAPAIATSSHVSEIGVPVQQHDIVLNNHGDIDALMDQIAEANLRIAAIAASATNAASATISASTTTAANAVTAPSPTTAPAASVAS